LCYDYPMKLKPLLFIAYVTVWLVLAIDPWYREDWLLENILVFVALPVVIWGERRFGFSPAAAWMLFVFFVLHAIGAHYTYSEMPWFDLFTRTFGFERNHYDRVAHFLFGFLLLVPFAELFAVSAKPGKTVFAFAFVFMIAASGFYEVLEWLATEVTHAELGTAFLGTQGDEWDAQKDMLMCYLGIIAGALIWRRRIL
jgi:putative membrane protein